MRVPDEGETGCRLPLFAFSKEPGHDSLQEIEDTLREACTPVLETERLVLRAPRLEDANAVAALANDRRIAENTARIPHPYRVADAREWIGVANMQAGERDLRDRRSRTAAVIGACGLDAARRDLPEIGYWLGVPYWGRGYATEAVRALIDHAFDELGHDALVAGARVSNPASRRVLEKCGFQWTGVAPLPHPRDPLLGADRPLPARAPRLGLAQGWGQAAARVRRRGVKAICLHRRDSAMQRASAREWTSAFR